MFHEERLIDSSKRIKPHIPGVSSSEKELNRTCTIRQRAYDAVDSNFGEPGSSFLMLLRTLHGRHMLDHELQERCVDVLEAGANDSQRWDTVLRNAVTALEDRIRDIGRPSDRKAHGVALVKEVFGPSGTMVSKIPEAIERARYEELFKGMLGLFRNVYAHRFVDPTPEEGVSTLLFIDLLLKKLEKLR